MNNFKFYSLCVLVVVAFLLAPSWENYHNDAKAQPHPQQQATLEEAADDDCNCTDSDVGCITDCQDAREQEPELIDLPPMY